MAAHFEAVLGKFSATADGLGASFEAMGWPAPLARTAAEAFVLYMLGFYTLEGAAQAMHAAGASAETARAAAMKFREAKAGA